MKSSSILFRISVISSVGAAFLALSFPGVSQAQGTECTFGQTLEVGVVDESVRCLQQYLNANGFVLTTEGPGSPGNETNKFGSLTETAVIKWQEDKGVSPTSGVFGPKSQAAYLLDMVNLLEIRKTEQASATNLEANNLTELLNQALQSVPTPQVAGLSTAADTEKKAAAERRLSDTMGMVFDTLEEVDSLRDNDPDEAADIDDDVRDAIEELFKAIKLYFDDEYVMAVTIADEALTVATEAFEDAGGESIKSKAEDLLDDVNDLYDDVQDLLDEAEDIQADTGDAKELLVDAADLLDEAEDRFDNREYRQAMSDAYDAEELIEDARDEIDILSDNETERYVEEVWKDFKDAEDEIDDADADGEDVEESLDLLKDAERRLKKADIAIDEKEYIDATEYAEEAADLIDEALDAVGGSDDEAEAEDAIDDAWKEYKKVKNEVRDAEDEGEDMDDAWEYLDEAKDLLNEAEDALDDEDYDEVMDLVDDALDLIDDADDEL